jgi:hypothetical protein
MSTFKKTMGIAPMALEGMVSLAAAEPAKAEVAAYEQSFEGYCQSVEDVLDSRPHKTSGAGSVNVEDFLLKWGREQGNQGLEGGIPLSRRRQAVGLVYREIMRKYLPDVTVAGKAPDAGVKVTVGDPRVAMWAPEGKTADLAGNIAKLGHLGLKRFLSVAPVASRGYCTTSPFSARRIVEQIS